MNERMIELANKANEDVGYTFKLEDANQIHTLMEKFAELIVKECVQSIEKTIETICDTDSEKMGCEFAITDMLEHFGVEL